MNYNTVHPSQAPQSVSSAPVIYNVPQTGATPAFYSKPQPSSGGKIRKHYNIKCVRGLCITIMVLGIICFIAQLVNIVLESGPNVSGGGIFGAFFYILTASFGIYSAKSRTTCPIVAFLVLSILSALISAFPLAIGSIDIAIRVARSGYSIDEEHGLQFDYTGRLGEDSSTIVAMGAIMIVVAVLNAALLIISSALACHGLCCSSSSSGAVLISGQVHYVTGPNGQQQMVIIPVSGQPQPTAAPGMVLPYSQNWTSEPGAVAGASASRATVPVQPPEYGRQLTPPPEYMTKEQ